MDNLWPLAPTSGLCQHHQTACWAEATPREAGENPGNITKDRRCCWALCWAGLNLHSTAAARSCWRGSGRAPQCGTGDPAPLNASVAQHTPGAEPGQVAHPDLGRKLWHPASPGHPGWSQHRACTAPECQRSGMELSRRDPQRSPSHPRTRWARFGAAAASAWPLVINEEGFASLDTLEEQSEVIWRGGGTCTGGSSARHKGGMLSSSPSLVALLAHSWDSSVIDIGCVRHRDRSSPRGTHTGRCTAGIRWQPRYHPWVYSPAPKWGSSCFGDSSRGFAHGHRNGEDSPGIGSCSHRKSVWSHCPVPPKVGELGFPQFSSQNALSPFEVENFNISRHQKLLADVDIYFSTSGGGK